MNDNVNQELIEALTILNRTSMGLAATLQQMVDGELNNLQPEEKSTIIINSLTNFSNASKIVAVIMGRTRGQNGTVA